MAELEATMSAEEYMRWGVYYAREAQNRELAALQARAQASFGR